MPVLGFISALLGSTRLPRKPLQSLAGVPLIIRVVERVRSLGCVDDLVVATDSAEGAAGAKQAGGERGLPRRAKEPGPDGVPGGPGRRGFPGFDLIVNVRGDEPFVPRDAVAGAILRVR